VFSMFCEEDARAAAERIGASPQLFKFTPFSPESTYIIVRPSGAIKFSGLAKFKACVAATLIVCLSFELPFSLSCFTKFAATEDMLFRGRPWRGQRQARAALDRLPFCSPAPPSSSPSRPSPPLPGSPLPELAARGRPMHAVACGKTHFKRRAVPAGVSVPPFGRAP